MKNKSISRRQFITNTTKAGLATSLMGANNVFAKGTSDKIRIGLIGTGQRGTKAGIIDCARADSNIELVAMGDLFEDHLEKAPKTIQNQLAKHDLPVNDIYKVTPETMFSGFDAYKKVIASDVDLIILTTPPVFRPIHFKHAVEAGKHVFIEKPVAVDPVGIRDIIKTSELAKEKGLTVVAGTQMRRARHLQALVERVRNGAIGEFQGGHSFRLGSSLSYWRKEESVRQPHWSDIEWQLRRWLFTEWASGDFIVEQHVHNFDILNWIFGNHPKKVTAGTGGRQARTGEAFLNVWDHISVEYEYPNGARVAHIGSQIDGVAYRLDMRVVGTKGRLYADYGNANIEGENPFEYDGPAPDPKVEEFRDTLHAIRTSTPLNEGKQVAESTLTAIMGRMAAKSGRAFKWDWALHASKQNLTPPDLTKFGDLPLAPVTIPGTRKLA